VPKPNGAFGSNDNIFERIRATISLADLVEHWLSEPGRPGRKATAFRCPFHDDRTPSLFVYPDGRWWCFSCDCGGDAIDFAMRLFHDDFAAAVERVAGYQEVAPQRRPQPRPRPAPGLSLDLATVRRWHDTMAPRHWAYWRSRGLSDRVIRAYLLGHDGQRYTIPHISGGKVFGVKRRIDTETCLQAGQHDAPPPKYVCVRGSQVGLYNRDALHLARERRLPALIVEGEIDALTLVTLDPESDLFVVVSPTGGGASWRPEWSRLFIGIQFVIAIFDNDEAGTRGALKVRHDISRARVLTWPAPWKDANEMLVGNPGAGLSPHPDLLHWLSGVLGELCKL